MGVVTARPSVSILRDPAFARLWFIQASTQVGGNMALYALTILVFATTRSNAAVSALVMSFLIPTILLSAVAGVIVDRLDVRMALIVPNAVRTLLTLGLALAGTNVALLLAAQPGDQPDDRVPHPGRGVDDPADRPEGPSSRRRWASSTSRSRRRSRWASRSLGHCWWRSPGRRSSLAVVTVFYAAATVTTLLLPSRRPSPPNGVRQPRHVREPIRQLREGLAAISGDREVSRPLIHLAAAASLVGVIGVLGPSLAISLGLDPQDLIVVVLPLGLGVVPAVLGLRRFDDGVSRRQRGETGLVIFGLLARRDLDRRRPERSADGVSIIPLVVVLAFCAGAAYAATIVSRPRRRSSRTCRRPSAAASSGSSLRSSALASLVPILVAGPLADATSGPA